MDCAEGDLTGPRIRDRDSRETDVQRPMTLADIAATATRKATRSLDSARALTFDRLAGS